ncbi:MAG: ribosomal protein S19 family protein [Candidatus Marsarchaeota archaeon]|nr:ribosomal protein S19 family protein [Candidatus Marsarchaeota archaeon]MCL5412993.1 ribosomal protein S19 family protein [Candidatus Marsarchaeota archaeon]
MARIFTFRGKTLEELQALKIDDFAKIIKSRQRRAIKRMSPAYKSVIEKADRSRKSNPGKTVRIHLREAVVLPSWVGMKFAVHDGKAFQEITITNDMIGHRIGEFVYTVKRVVHSAPGIRATRGSKFLAVK